MVDVQIVLSPKRLKEFPGLSEQAINNAIESAIIRIKQVAMTETPVGDASNYGYSAGRAPGTLRDSFVIAKTPRSIVMNWSALWKGVDYASIVEKGRTDRNPFPGRNYAAATSQRALQILLEELAREFQAIGG